MRNMKLAGKIGVGFGLVIAIAIALGGVAILSMRSVQGDVQRLAAETVPQVTVANSVERSSLETMYNMRGYALSDNKDYLAQAQADLADVKKALADAEALAGKYQGLAVLKKNTADAKARVEEYSALADQTISVKTNLEDERKIQDAAAPAFMNACNDYLARNVKDLQADRKSVV